MLSLALDMLLVAAAGPLLLAALYLCLLALLSRRSPPPAYAAPHRRFDVVVPAHDEAGQIAATVENLLAMDYPRRLWRLFVVADNCSDATAERARLAGAEVLVREDPARRGKGYALAHAFARSAGDGFAEAVVVVDADTVVSRNLLLAFAARLDAGGQAVQAHYGVRNPDASWRTRLMAVAFALFHAVRSIGRERLGCSSGLRGNGMCFSTKLLREVPHDAFSLVEDVEYGIRLGLAGHRVHYAAEAEVLGEMVSTAASSTSQRRRWEGGRGALARQHALPLLKRAAAQRDVVLLDLALDLLVPPLSLLAGGAAVGGTVAFAAALVAGGPLLCSWAWFVTLAALSIYVIRGWWLSGTGWKGLEGLLHAPIYVAWKVGLALTRSHRAPGTWVRTARERGA